MSSVSSTEAAAGEPDAASWVSVGGDTGACPDTGRGHYTICSGAIPPEQVLTGSDEVGRHTRVAREWWRRAPAGGEARCQRVATHV
jgi:hypothetical protein